MNENIREFLDRIQALEQSIEMEAKIRRQQWQADFEERKIRFEKEVLDQQRRFKQGLLGYMLSAQWRNVLTMPFIYPVLLPMLLLDGFVTLYQSVCFPLYRIPKIKRADYFVFDRTHLAYLNLLEKVNCAYCSYGNGLIAYCREIFGRTEQYWCPIKHTRRILHAHPHYHGFVDYGDAQNYAAELERLRSEITQLAASDAQTHPVV